MKYEPVKVEGEHVQNKDISYKLWQKIKSKYPEKQEFFGKKINQKLEDYEVALPLSQWKQRSVNIDLEF